MKRRILIVCTTDSMIWNFLIPHIKELEQKGFYVECACSITGDFYKNLVEIHGIKMNEIPFVRSPYSLKNLDALKKLCKLIKEKKFDTIFCHEPVGGVMGRVAGRKYRCKVIYMAHGFHFYKGAPVKNWLLYYPVEKFCAHLTDVLITINKEDHDLAQKKMKAKCVKYVPGVGIDLQKYSQSTIAKAAKRREFGIPEDAVVLLSVGELNSNKNHETIIRAIADMDVYYMIAGDGDLRQHLQNVIDTLGACDRVKLLGYRCDVKDLYRAADIFVFPSFREGLSVALMEAMASGLPCIASKIRGNVDLIENNKGGFLCDPQNDTEFTVKLNTLASNTELREKMGRHNLITVQKFGVETAINEMCRIFDAELLGVKTI